MPASFAPRCRSQLENYTSRLGVLVHTPAFRRADAGVPSSDFLDQTCGQDRSRLHIRPKELHSPGTDFNVVEVPVLTFLPSTERTTPIPLPTTPSARSRGCSGQRTRRKSPRSTPKTCPQTISRQDRQALAPVQLRQFARAARKLRLHRFRLEHFDTCTPAGQVLRDHQRYGCRHPSLMHNPHYLEVLESSS